MKKKTLVIVFAIACTGTAHAQETTLPTLTVTASPIIEDNKLDKFSSFSTTVTEDQIRDLSAVDLPSALRMTPGVEISRYDDIGSYSGNEGGAVYIRGMGASRPGSEIKTYIDGIPVYMGVWDHPLLDLLPINGMRSITVNKSPQPQINGNNFASIELKTKQATEDGMHASGSISAGSFGTAIEKADLESRQGDVDFMLAASHSQSNGWRQNSNGDLSNAMGRVGFRINENWSVGASFVSVTNRVGDPGNDTLPITATSPSNGVARNDSDTNLVTAFVTHRNGDWQGELRVYDNNGKNNLTNDAIWGTFNTNFSMSGVHWKEQLSPWQGGTLVAGIDQDRTSGNIYGPNVGGMGVAASTTLPEFVVTSANVAVSQKVDLSKDWTLIPSAGIRVYDNNQYASKTAPHAGASLVSEQVTWYANASRGILYPGLEGPGLQAALPFMFAGTTWNQLSPEVDNHAEIGAKLTPSDTSQFDISLFQDNVANRYLANFVFGNTVFSNTGAYQTKGAELSVRQQVDRNWKVFGGVTLLDSSLSTLPYAPKTAITVGVNGQIGAVSVVIDAQHQSSMYVQSLSRTAVSPNSLTVDEFTVANARLAYRLPSLGKRGEVFVAAENLFNRSYEYNHGYPMPGRNYRVGLAASF